MQLIVSKKNKTALYVVYALVLLATTIYSFALIDPNLTFFNNAVWAAFRDSMVQLGYYQRQLSWFLYLTLMALLFVFHYIFVKNDQKVNLKYISVMVGVILLFSYPFLSHDLFNYMFDAKIFTYYQQNPYLHRALDYPHDTWLRFMHWTHRTYAYGPVYLPLSFIPSYLSFAKFALGFFFFKLMNVLFYWLAIFVLNKINRRSAVFFATNPYILVEGLISAHNDLIYLSMSLVGIYFLFKNSEVKGRIMLLLSAGIKYISLPLIGLTKNNWMYSNYIVLLAQMVLIVYVCMQKGIQQWYFLAFIAFIPFFDRFVIRLNILFAALLISYYPYIRLGGWGEESHVVLKEKMILIGIALNILILSYLLLKDRNLLQIKTGEIKKK